MSISIVVPIYNEQESIPHLYRSLVDVLPGLGRPYELVFVDDGSSDRSRDVLASLAATDPHVKIVELRRNYGQTAAMSAGIECATGEIIVTMDGDLQNDPADIPMMLARLEEGYDLVHGWRRDRHDALIRRKLPSRVANWLISRVTRVPVNDLGCTLKVMRADIARELELFGDMHRFIPILGYWRGARCLEVETRHHARRYGESKYGMSRVLRVVLDLITVKYLIQYLVSPMRLFGTLGLVSGLLGLLSGLVTVVMKLWQGIDMTGNPLLLLAVFSVMLGSQFFVLGMLGELGARVYFAVQRRQPYAIRRLTNFDSADDADSGETSLSVSRAA